MGGGDAAQTNQRKSSLSLVLKKRRTIRFSYERILGKDPLKLFNNAYFSVCVVGVLKF